MNDAAAKHKTTAVAHNACTNFKVDRLDWYDKDDGFDRHNRHVGNDWHDKNDGIDRVNEDNRLDRFDKDDGFDRHNQDDWHNKDNRHVGNDGHDKTHQQDNDDKDFDTISYLDAVSVPGCRVLRSRGKRVHVS